MAYDGKVTLEVGSDTKPLENDVKKLANKFKESTQAVEKQVQKVDELKAKLSGLKSGEITATSAEVKKMQSDFDKATASIGKTQSEIQSLYGQMEQLQANAFKDPISETPVFTEKEQAQFNLINAKLDELEPKLEADKQKAAEMGEALKNATGAATQAEIKKTTQDITEAETKLEKLKITADETGEKLKNKMAEVQAGTPAIAAGFEKLGNKLVGMAKRVFVFAIITKALRGLRTTIGSVLMSDENFRNSLYQLQAAFWTAFAPILNFVVPALKTLVSWITSAVVAIGRLIAALTGKSYSAMVDEGKALQKQTAAYAASTKAKKKNAKATKDKAKADEKELAVFDEINKLQDNSDTSDSGAGDVGDAGAGGGVAGGFDKLGDISGLDGAQEKLTAIATLIGSIAAGLALWKISNFIQDLAAGGEKAQALRNSISQIGGAILVAAGAVLLIKGYSDAWVNGIDWGNFALMLSGLALVIGGIALAVSPIAAAFVAIGGGIALLVLGIKDMIAQGPTLQNVLTVVTGLLIIFAATLYIAGAPVAIVVTALAALVAAFIYLWNTNEEFRDFWIDLWEKIKKAVEDVWESFLKPILNELGNLILWIWYECVKPTWEEHIKPALIDIGNGLKVLWNETIKPTLGFIGNEISKLWNDSLKPFIDDFLVPVFQKQFKSSLESIKSVAKTVFDGIGGFVDGLKTAFNGFVDFIDGLSDGDWKKAFKGLANVAIGIFNTIVSGIETGINLIISSINSLIGGINSITATVGDKIGLDLTIPNIPKISLGRIPALARGAVLPANKPFLTVVGDQKEGTNIEAPLTTIVEAMNIALAKNQGNQNITIEFGGTMGQLIRILQPEIKKEQARRGVQLVTGGGY